MFLLALFTTPIELGGIPRFVMMLPLCLSIAVVYKATRLDGLGEVVKASLVLWVTIVLGMCAVGVGMWAVFSIMV